MLAGTDEKALLTSIVVAHTDVVTDHVSHGAGQEVGLVSVEIDADPHGFLAAHGRGYRHPGFSA